MALIDAYRKKWGGHRLLGQAFNMLEMRDLQPGLAERTEMFEFFGKGSNASYAPIDELIKVLQKAKDKGYTALCERWYGYEDNYFILLKNEPETEEDIIDRLREKVSNNIRILEAQEYQKAKIQKQIDELQNQIRTLQGKL